MSTVNRFILTKNTHFPSGRMNRSCGTPWTLPIEFNGTKEELQQKLNEHIASGNDVLSFIRSDGNLTNFSMSKFIVRDKAIHISIMTVDEYFNWVGQRPIVDVTSQMIQTCKVRLD